MNRSRTMLALISFAAMAVIAQDTARGQFVAFSDPAGDAVVRRTDEDADGPFDPELQALPDLLAINLSSFAPAEPHVYPFTGAIDIAGGFIRIDIIFDGLVNPPGPLGFDDSDPTYEPDRYGTNPIVGFIEFDIDGNENTGGEIDTPKLRYLGNVARFGGLPTEPRFIDRAAIIGDDLDGDLATSPMVERSGEEFHLSLIGDGTNEIIEIVENDDGDSSSFDAGEVWWVKGEFFHRAHSYDDFTVMCQTGDDRYEPEHLLQFSHDLETDRTTMSLVIPKTNAAAALLEAPDEPVEGVDGCDNNQYSIEEAVTDMIFSATVADPFTRLLPEFQLIADWEFQSGAPALDPASWRVTALVGTAYLPSPVDDEEFIWSDVYPNIVAGDVNGDGVVDDMDQADIDAFIAAVDGDSDFDDDGDDQNGSVDWDDWADDFCVYDVNFDGFVDAFELQTMTILGDMNVDGIVDGRDIAAFSLALLDPSEYALQFPGARPDELGDVNGDGSFDSGDISAFIALLIGFEPSSTLGDMNNDGVANALDIPAFSLGLTQPGVYTDTFSLDPVARGDMNGDGVFDGRDISGFLQLIIP